MGDRSLSFCNLVAIWFETLLYGVYVVFCVLAIRLLLFRPQLQSNRRGHGPATLAFTPLKQAYLAGTFALFTFATIHVAAGLVMLSDAFVLSSDVPSDLYFARTDGPLNTLRIATFLGSIIFADTFMIHRVYVLWHRSVVIMLIPLFNLVLAFISGILLLSFSSQTNNLPPFSSPYISIGFSAFLTPTLRILVPLHIALSFTTNMWITVMIGVREYRECNIEDGEWSWKVVAMLISKTGIIYPPVAFISLLLSIAQVNGQVIPYAALTPLAAILPTLAILADETDCSPSSSQILRQRVDGPRSPAAVERALPTVTFGETSNRTPHMISDPTWPSIQVEAGPRNDLRALSSPLTPSYSYLVTRTRLPPLPRTPPPIPQPPSINMKGRAKGTPTPLHISREVMPDSPPLAPHTPEPRYQLPSPFETHFPRDKGRHERISQQTFNPRRASAGQGGTAYTTFGSSDIARRLASAKQVAGVPPMPSTPSRGLRNKDSRNKVKGGMGRSDMTQNRDLASGVHMTKAVERRIDYIEAQGSLPFDQVASPPLRTRRDPVG